MEDERSSVNMETEALGPLQAAPFMRKLSVQPWGVLGTQQSKEDGIREVGPPPDSETAIVDPAGLVYIQSLGPGGAGGASAVIYKHLGIADHEAFPAEVVSAITQVLDAKHYSYGDNHVIHVVGPDLRCATYAEDDDRAVEALATAYLNLLAEFASSGCRCLRLLPISGGIFRGRYADEMPGMTIGALGAAFAHLQPRMQREVLKASCIELCIFMESEFEEFKMALSQVQQAMVALPGDGSDHEESDRGAGGQDARPQLECQQSLSAAMRSARRSATLDHASDPVADVLPSSHDEDRPLCNGAEQGGSEPFRRRSESLSSKNPTTSATLVSRRASLESHAASTVTGVADRDSIAGQGDGRQALDQGSDSGENRDAKKLSDSRVLNGAADAGQPPVLLGAEAGACEDEKSGYMNTKRNPDDDFATEVTHVVLEGGRREPAHARASQVGTAQAGELNDVGTEILSESGVWRPAPHDTPHSLADRRVSTARVHASPDSADQAEGAKDVCTEVSTARRVSKVAVDDPSCTPHVGDDTEVLTEGGAWRPLHQMPELARRIQDLASTASAPHPVNDGTEILSESGFWRPGGSVAEPISQRAGTIVTSIDVPQVREPMRVSLRANSVKELQSIRWLFGERGASIKRLGHNFPPHQAVQRGDRLRSINGSDVLDMLPDEIRQVWRDEQHKGEFLVLEFIGPAP